MKKAVEARRPAPGKCRSWMLGFALAAGVFASGCSMPNLEEPECTAARDIVKEFYSYHFGSEMKFSPENLTPREKYLTPEFIGSLPREATEADVFTTNSNDYPKAFRVGACRVVDPARADIEILLFWRDDVRNEQREIHAEVAKKGDRWLIDKIKN